MPSWVVLDACVLHPIAVADTLLWVADAEVFQPLWSEEILDELRRSVLARLPDANIDGRIADMVEAFPDALVVGHEALAAGLTNDPRDRHVLAAAIAGEAGVIVTTNLRHFPPAACDPHGVQAQHPDEFLTKALTLDAEPVVRALGRQARAKKNPPISLAALLERLATPLPTFAALASKVVREIEVDDPGLWHD